MFNSYRIPAANLLNQLGDVDDDGNYFSPILNSSLRFAMSLSVLSSGRVVIGCVSNSFLRKAITIAIRYSAVRKQFGPDDSEEEFAVLEYQQQVCNCMTFGLSELYQHRPIYFFLIKEHSQLRIT